MRRCEGFALVGIVVLLLADLVSDRLFIPRNKALAIDKETFVWVLTGDFDQ